MAGICVIGAGPAGSTFAARMAQMGHAVTLVECSPFPRSRLGESLSAGVLPLLEAAGSRDAIERARFPRVRRVHVRWDAAPVIVDNTRDAGILVDRGAFDSLLLEHARSRGVRVIQPATVRQCRWSDGRWSIDITEPIGQKQLQADFVADATGRAARLRSSRRRIGCRTIALYAYWRGNTPDEPRIEAGFDAWYWGVPLPDGSYNVLVFIDAARFQGAPANSLESRYLELLGRSNILPDAGAHMDSPVRSSDASAWLEENSASARRISIGDAAIAIDPISSSGVQKAIQTALSGAVVANTLLQRVDAQDLAIRFYRSSLCEASVRHAGWAAGHYRRVADERGGGFWLDRGRSAQPQSDPVRFTPPASREDWSIPLAPSSLLQIVEAPCLDGDFVSVRRALRHPALREPVAFLGGHEIAPLVECVRPGATFTEIVVAWSSRVPPRSGFGIARWLLEHGILMPRESAVTEIAQ